MVQSSETEGSAGVATASAPAADGSTARAAGRGGLAIAGAKVAFILFGFIQQPLLPALLGADGYGQVALVLSIVSIVNNVIVATSIQGVSRAVSSAPGRESEAFRATLRVHVVVAVLVSLAFATFAGLIASFEGAPHVAVPLRVAALIVLLYGVYAPLVGSLNGRRRFIPQAALDTGYGALRLAGVAFGAYFFMRASGSGVLGVFVGSAMAAALIVPFALSQSGIGRAGEGGPSASEYLEFLFPLAGGQIFLNLLMQTDFLLLRRFAGAVAASPQAADSLQGVYRGVQLFSFLPYQLLMSVTFILFPMLARARAEGDREAVRGYTMTGVRLALVLTVLMIGVVSGIAPHLLRLVYPVEIWSRGGDALRILSVGMGAFSVLGITCAALTSLGRERESAALTLVAVLLVAVGCFYLVPRAAFGPEMLVKSALATSAALAAVAIVGGIRLSRVAGGFVEKLTLVRALVTLVVCIAAGSRLPWLGKVGTLVEAAALGVLGLVVLIALGEIGKQDLARIKQVAGKKG
ncbi:Membrane protein implicated in protein export [Minicystis rosea]|nr:Membrane protein implicated in protein export [Minicystis rosea]